MVELDRLENEEDIAEVKRLVMLHQQYTGSTVAAGVLADWEGAVPQFVKVMPTDYKRVLDERKQAAQAAEEAEAAEAGSEG